MKLGFDTTCPHCRFHFKIYRVITTDSDLKRMVALQAEEIRRLQVLVDNGVPSGPPDPPRPLIRRDYG